MNHLTFQSDLHLAALVDRTGRPDQIFTRAGLLAHRVAIEEDLAAAHRDEWLSIDQLKGQELLRQRSKWTGLQQSHVAQGAGSEGREEFWCPCHTHGPWLGQARPHPGPPW